MSLFSIDVTLRPDEATAKAIRIWSESKMHMNTEAALTMKAFRESGLLKPTDPVQVASTGIEIGIGIMIVFFGSVCIISTVWTLNTVLYGEKQHKF